jgi:hypothetical protein
MSDGPDRTIYRTTSPDMLALWDKWKAERSEYDAKRDTFLAEFAPAGCGAMVTQSFGIRIVGVSVEGYRPASTGVHRCRSDGRRGSVLPCRCGDYRRYLRRVGPSAPSGTG